MRIGLSQANAAVQAAQAHAESIGVRITVAVLDEGGHVLALSRMDGAFPASVQVAEAKALGAVMLHRNGDSLAGLNQERPAFFQAVDRLLRLPIIPGLGSVLVREGHTVLGAIGVSGARPEQDLECAEAGLAALTSLRG